MNPADAQAPLEADAIEPEPTPDPIDEAAQLADLAARAAAAVALRGAKTGRLPTTMGQGRAQGSKALSRPSWCALGCGTLVPAKTTYCPRCIPRAAEDRIRARLVDAYASLPAASRWCVLDGSQLDAFVGQLAAYRARRALDARRVLITGHSGAGKTTLAAAMLRAIVDRARVPGASPAAVDTAESARFVVAFDVAYCRADTALGREPPELLLWKRASVIVLDDLGAEPKVHSSALGELIHYRESAQLQTIVTTGYPKSYIEEHYGAGIYRRIADDAVVIALPARKP